MNDFRQPPKMSQLPISSDVLLEVFRLLSFDDVAWCSITCRQFRDVIDRNWSKMQKIDVPEIRIEENNFQNEQHRSHWTSIKFGNVGQVVTLFGTHVSFSYGIFYGMRTMLIPIRKFFMQQANPTENYKRWIVSRRFEWRLAFRLKNPIKATKTTTIDLSYQTMDEHQALKDLLLFILPWLEVTKIRIDCNVRCDTINKLLECVMLAKLLDKNGSTLIISQDSAKDDDRPRIEHYIATSNYDSSILNIVAFGTLIEEWFAGEREMKPIVISHGPLLSAWKMTAEDWKTFMKRFDRVRHTYESQHEVVFHLNRQKDARVLEVGWTHQPGFENFPKSQFHIESM